MGKKVAIIITTYSQDKLLERNISSIKKNTLYENYQIYLVDDASPSKIGNKIKKKFPTVNILINKENKGFAKSNNLSIKKAEKEYNPDYFLLLNDDCEVVEKGWLQRLIRKSKEYPQAGIFGIKLIYPDKSVQWAVKSNKTYFFEKEGRKEKNKEFSKTHKMKEVIGAFMLIKKEVIKEIKGFDEGFSPFYGEESDLCFRASKKGYKIIYLGDMEIIHHRNKTISILSKEYVWFIKKRNAIRLEWLNYGVIKIVKFSFIHFGSAILSKHPLKKLKLLLKAYKENLKKYDEILLKRKERNSWKKENQI